MTKIANLLTPPLENRFTVKMMEYYQEAKKLHYVKQYASAITTFGKFLEVAAEALCNYMNLGDCDASCGKVVEKMIKSQYSNRSLKLYIPRAIQAAFSIRNGRDAAHGTTNMVTSSYDSEYVASVCDWVLGELVVELSSRDRESVRGLLDTITEKKTPIIYENSDGDLVILQYNLPVKHEIIIILYFRNMPLPISGIVAGCKKPPTTIRSALKRMEGERYITRLRSGAYELLPPGILKAEEIIHSISSD